MTTKVGGYTVHPSRVNNSSVGNLGRRRKSKQQLKVEEEKKLNKAYRIIYRGGDLTKLTEEAHHACQRLKIKPDELLVRNMEWFELKAARGDD